MLFFGTSIIHHSTEGVFLLCNILDLLIHSFQTKWSEYGETESAVSELLSVREVAGLLINPLYGNVVQKTVHNTKRLGNNFLILIIKLLIT